MYASRYFPGRYFPRTYWPLGSGAVVVPTDATVHLAGSLYIEPWIAAGLWVNARDTSSGGSALWTPSGDVVLLIDALAQTQGSQTVVATIGPNGTLGDTSASESSDPILGSTGWEMGEGPRHLSFGDVLAAEFAAAEGFTMIAAVHGGSIAATSEAFLQNWILEKQNVGNTAGLIWFMTGDRQALRVTYDGIPGNYDVSLAGDSLSEPSPSVLGVHFDPSQARGSRIGMWRAGVDDGAQPSLQTGADGILQTAGFTLQIGSAARRVHWLLIQTGIMSAAEHLDIYEYLTQRGWGQQESPMSGVSRQPIYARLIPPDTDNRVVLDELHNSATGAWTNGATVTATLYDSSGTEVAGSSITLTYVAGSNGKYVGTLPYTVQVVPGNQYTIKAVAITAAGRRTFAETYTARATPAAA